MRSILLSDTLVRHILPSVIPLRGILWSDILQSIILLSVFLFVLLSRVSFS